VSIIRIGSNDKYASGWEGIFSKGKKASSETTTKPAAKKKAPKKSTKKASPKKASPKKTTKTKK
jgi:hypothetical protein